MIFSTFRIFLIWTMVILLLANSIIILVNIFDFPSSGMRHLISFIAAAGFVTVLVFLVSVLSRFLKFWKRH
jgi:hypothetical protein